MVVGSKPDEVNAFFYLPNTSSQPLTKNEYQKQKNHVSGEGPVHKAHNFTAICEPIV
jgi:hypothetical protein